jgi:SAM-dependent methyltransferase
MMKNEDLINHLPIISIYEGISTVSFDSMPFWEGRQKKPGMGRINPFSLTAKIGSPIMQTASDNLITDVVSAYQSDKYNFITEPPGVSSYATSLGEQSVLDVENVIGNNYIKNILEIGGGSTWVAGRLCERLTPETYTLVDPSVSNQEEGVEVISDYFPNQLLDDRHFDLVLGFSVLEHVPDPLNFLCNIRKQLTDNGKVILTYPDCEDQLRRGDINVFLHEHFSYFTENSSRWIASTAGFNVKSLHSKNDLFTLVLEASHGNSLFSSTLDESGLLLNSAKMIQNLLTNTAKKIKYCLDDGQHVGFHGATNGLNSFLFITGLGDYPNISIYDGDRSKLGMYLPASASPIKHYTDKSYGDNSMIVISAMSFYQQILDVIISKYKYSDHQIIRLGADIL